MVAKRKASEVVAAVAEDYVIDWWAQPRRAFKRGFLAYTPGRSGPAGAAKRRAAIGVTVEDPAGADATPIPAASFEEIGVLPSWLKQALKEGGCHKPIPIQAQAVPIALAGQNLAGITSATPADRATTYLLPAIVHTEDQSPLSADEPGPVTLILAPTREIVQQIAAEAARLLKFSSRSSRHAKGLRIACVHEGGSRKEQLAQLGAHGAHLVVGTPERLHEMGMQEQVSFLRVTFLVLDGTDAMWRLGVWDQVESISSWIRPERQTLILTSQRRPKGLAELEGKLCFAGGTPVKISESW
eukprot:gnl/TRDRNA2_/TRDRNA2_45039_c0_seq1.p1 gnl/TRDRNA2_/TRDRNA2_45039_c0~~gnl/TRDRNA2_/TRDRNA2_45039_c0_seq1.p1  ORF type:complete len:328 (-),score=40.40 gnl/TRDRNA2_/TRDRNA2_45039_c0_seq1:51-947(-)